MSILYKYQNDISLDTSRLKILKKSRQIGGTFLKAYEKFNNAIFFKKNQIIVSNSQRQSKLVMEYINKFMNAYKLIPEMKGIHFEIDQAVEKKLPEQYGGASIYSVPPSPETIRGLNGDVLLDEFALMKNDKKVYEAVLPMILRGHSIDIISTCYGMSNMFYNIYSDENLYKDYKRNSINIYEAIEQGLNVDIELIRNNYDEDSFRQEFLCEFIDESDSYFPYSLIRELIEDFEENEIQGDVKIGIDIGRSNDKTAIIVLKEFNGVYYLVRKTVLTNTEFDKQIEIISQVFYEFNPSKVYIDKGAIGMQLAETLQKRFIFVQGVNFTNNFISEIVTNAKKIFEQRKFKFNEDKDLITQIHSINRKVNESNFVSFKSDRTKAGHSDSAWALLLALHAYSRPLPIATWSN